MEEKINLKILEVLVSRENQRPCFQHFHSYYIGLYKRSSSQMVSINNERIYISFSS